jgi:hypothetical protein
VRAVRKSSRSPTSKRLRTSKTDWSDGSNACGRVTRSVPGGHHVDARLAQARAQLEAFAEQVQRREHSESGGSADVPKSGAVAEQAGSVMAPEAPGERRDDAIV